MQVKRKSFFRAAAVVGAVGLTAGLLAAGPSSASTANGKAQADALRDVVGSPGALVVVKEGDSIERYGSGSTSLGGQELPDEADQLRVASNTKMFVSVALLQLVDEGKLELDAPIGKYLPGLVKGEGIDEKEITVRQLLQHTGGLSAFPGVDVLLDPSLQLFPPAPEQMVSLGLRSGSQSEPGTTFEYSNTGYIVLGLLVEKLTGQRLGEALEQRIIDPLGLEETSYAHAGDKQIEGPHMTGYWGEPALMTDVTGYEPGILAGSGALVSSGSDLAVFVDALVDGKLFSKARMADIQNTFEDTGYGLGLLGTELSCGTEVWGHNGNVPGYFTYVFSDGEQAVFAGVNLTPLGLTPARATLDEMLRIMEAEFCGADERSGAALPEAFYAELELSRQLADVDQLPLAR